MAAWAGWPLRGYWLARRPGGHRVSFAERLEIKRGRDAGLGFAEIARRIGRDRSVVWREYQRNCLPDGDCYALMAHAMATQNARRPKTFTSTAAKQRHELTRAKAIAALHELDRAGAKITFESVADYAGVSRSWLYTQTDLKDEIRRLRARNQPQHATPTPARQRASDDSVRQRLDLALRRNRELATENQQLRRQLAHALGQLRDTPPTTRRNPITIGPY
jgi:IS30 family transposase